MLYEVITWDERRELALRIELDEAFFAEIASFLAVFCEKTTIYLSPFQKTNWF